MAILVLHPYKELTYIPYTVISPLTHYSLLMTAVMVILSVSRTLLFNLTYLFPLIVMIVKLMMLPKAVLRTLGLRLIWLILLGLGIRVNQLFLIGIPNRLPLILRILINLLIVLGMQLNHMIVRLNSQVAMLQKLRKH